MGRKRDNFLRSNKVSLPSKVQFFCKFKPSIGCSISRIISRFEGEFFDGEETSEASFEIKQGVSSRHCRRARRFSRQIVMARPAPLVARSTATRHSRAESPERPTRASRETVGADFVARKPMAGEETANISSIFDGAKSRFVTNNPWEQFSKFDEMKNAGQQIWEICLHGPPSNQISRMYLVCSYVGAFKCGLR